MLNRFIYSFAFSCLLALVSCHPASREKLTDYVNPMLGTATLWEAEDLGYHRERVTRTWGAETFPGASLPNAMVQVTPVTKYHSGSGYQYEDTTICGFAHTSKGHWNLCHFPILPVQGAFDAVDYASAFSHEKESAHPGYYQVYLDRYGVNVELTGTLRCAFHQYTFDEGASTCPSVLLDLTRSNERVKDWAVRQAGTCAFSGFQQAGETIYFYAESDVPVQDIREVVTPYINKKGKPAEARVYVVSFEQDAVSDHPDSGRTACNPASGRRNLSLRIGFSFVSEEGAKENLRQELTGKTFAQVRQEADEVWEKQLSAIRVKGGSERQRGLFYSTLYRSLLWPCLRSDANGDYRDIKGQKCNNGFYYYTDPSFWDDHRNKLILLALLRPDVACDVVKSITDKGEKNNGYMPTFFHGDHAATFVAGLWSRGIRDFDLQRAYRLILKNATVPGKEGRRYMNEYLSRGWISDKDSVGIPYWKEYKAGAQKTLEYAYDDYAVAQVALAIGDTTQYEALMRQSLNYKNVFDPSTGFYRGRNAQGEWLKDFDPYYPYFQHMWREANAWNLLFYPPHDLQGLFSLYGPEGESSGIVEQKLDSLFSEPWRGYEVENLTGFIGQYCHGNQPGHHLPFVYALIGKPEKSQRIIDAILDRFYDMGADHLAYAGMDDAGEMSAWYVLAAIGLYTWSPADPEYLVTRPLFDEVELDFPGRKPVVIQKTPVKSGEKGTESDAIDIYPGTFLPDSLLRKGGTFVYKNVK
ncbi:MAG: GH92 family glycosyl hydrolase [Bacteroidales bacterium]|nr:GH92 family glycosyl hydrolase [Bacteroidales bacterium]